MTIYGYADAEQLSDFNTEISTQNLTIYGSIREFNEKEGGLLPFRFEEKLVDVFPIQREITDDEMLVLVAGGGSFDFLSDAREDIYTGSDGFPLE
jgi:hypothetical protein